MVRNLLGLWPYDWRYLKGILASLGTFVILLTVKSFLHGVKNVLLLGLFAIGGVVVFLSFLVVLRLDEEDKQLLCAIGRVSK